MKRIEKYPNTIDFKYYNANPKNRITSDCVIRALSLGCNIPYNEVVMKLAELQCKTGYDSYSTKITDMFLKELGWIKYKQPRKIDNTKFTGTEFCRMLRLNQDDRVYICNIGGHHVTTIINSRIHDIWDCCDRCIGNYWRKEGE